MSMDESTDAIKRMASAAGVVRAFCGSDASRTMVAMLDALIDSYKIDLMHVNADGLVRLQSCIRQVLAIRAVVADESQDLPKI